MERIICRTSSELLEHATGESGRGDHSVSLKESLTTHGYRSSGGTLIELWGEEKDLE